MHDHPYHNTKKFSDLVPEYFERAPNNNPRAGDVGLYDGHIVIYDQAAGAGKDVWSASRTDGPPYGAGKSTWYGKEKTPPTWYRPKKMI